MIYIVFIIIINIIWPNLALQLVADDFDKPIFATSDSTHPDLIYIVEQDGIIKIINNNQVQEEFFLDIKDRVHKPLFPGDEMGLLGLTFDPDYNSNGFIYVNYNDKSDNTIISRFKSSNNIVDTSSEIVLFKFKQP